MSRARRAEDGAGTVAVLGLVAALLTVALGAAALLSAVVAGHRAAAAADLAALAGAAALASAGDLVPSGGGAAPPGGGACAAAERVARANGALVTSCVVQGLEVWVGTTAAPAWPGLGVATARARAGPPGAG